MLKGIIVILITFWIGRWSRQGEVDELKSWIETQKRQMQYLFDQQKKIIWEK